MNTELSQKSLSRTYPTKVALRILEILLLTGIGAVGVLLHAKFRFPSHLPGHWGIVFMALLFSGRLFSQQKIASSFSSIGAVGMLLLPLGFTDPFIPIMYMFIGFLVDIVYGFFKTKNQHIIFIALLSGVAYSLIPIIRMIISLSVGFSFGTFATGFMYPLVMHFVFGSLGGMIALGAFTLFKKKN